MPTMTMTSPTADMQQTQAEAAVAASQPKKHPPRNGNPRGFLSRLEHCTWNLPLLLTWANFTFPMATGGLALLLSEQTQGFPFRGLQTIGKVVYVFDLVLFTTIACAITWYWPGTLKSSVMHPTEGLFVATALLSVASIITGVARYGIPACDGANWIIVAYRVLFWIYFVVSFAAAVGLYCLLFVSPRLKLQDMTPAWDLPIFPFMLSGTAAAAGAGLQPPDQALPMIIGGLLAQGLGMLVSMGMYASYVRRMIQYGFPSPNSRPAMFIAVGPPAFTSLAIIGLANDYPAHYDTFGADEVTIQILRVIALMTSVFIFSLSLWFFSIAAIANLAVRRQISFHLNWYAYVFPNVGFTIAVISIGKALRSTGVMAVGSAMTVLLVCMWLFVVTHHARAVAAGDIMADGKDEDFYVNERDHRHVKKDVQEVEKQA
ncbi:voltage-dependent anion channel-domain-containing protein [Xylariomycetidae sp. FL2044]|nr:voltage-dependent anion channel-domain-containing protein [Xylariomycetidae sp. FL2044]